MLPIHLILSAPRKPPIPTAATRPTGWAKWPGPWRPSPRRGAFPGVGAAPGGGWLHFGSFLPGVAPAAGGPAEGPCSAVAPRGRPGPAGGGGHSLPAGAGVPPAGAHHVRGGPAGEPARAGGGGVPAVPGQSPGRGLAGPQRRRRREGFGPGPGLLGWLRPSPACCGAGTS